jgi:subtilisin family serine protease
MKKTSGRPEIVVGLVDGPVAVNHPDLATQGIRELPGRTGSHCARTDSAACQHGTYVAGILSARRGSAAPAICPDCTLLSRPIFAEAASGSDQMPSATPEELAAAIIDCIQGGARVINLSVGLAHLAAKGEHALEEALDFAAQRSVMVVAAAGNQGTIGSSALTRHPWVIPVVACDSRANPIRESNLGNSIGRRGLRAPGDSVTSLGSTGQSLTMGGTSVSTPFVTGTIALLCSEFPAATAPALIAALRSSSPQPRRTIVPPLLNAWAAYQHLASLHTTKSAP